MAKAAQLAGQRFGMLTVIEVVGRQCGKVLWRCVCDCGVNIRAPTGNLRSGISTNCGCVRKSKVTARNYVHGGAPRLAREPEYYAWSAMLQRCHNPRHPKFRYWGGRGIRVCDEWRRDYAAFRAHMGPRPGEGYSLDRWPDMNGDYVPGNVRWATQAQQVANSRDHGPAISAALKRVHAERPGFNRRAKIA